MAKLGKRERRNKIIAQTFGPESTVVAVKDTSFLKELARVNGIDNNLDILDTDGVPDWMAGYNVKCLFNNVILTEETRRKFRVHFGVEAASTKVGFRKAIDESAERQFTALMCNIEEDIDYLIEEQPRKVDFKAFCIEAGFPKKVVSKAEEELRVRLKELYLAKEGKIFGFAAYTKVGFNNLIAGYESIIRQLESYKEVHQHEMKINKLIEVSNKRKGKPEIFEHLKFQRDDLKLGIVSIAPSTVNGAKKLVVYNTKYKQLGFYVAGDSTPLMISRTSIAGYNEILSLKVRIKSPEKELIGMQKWTDAQFTKFFNNQKATKTQQSSRINEDTLMVKVYR